MTDDDFLQSEFTDEAQVEVEVNDTAAAPVQAEEPAPKPEQQVPLAALQAVREELKLHKSNSERMARIEQMLAQQTAPKPQAVPDMFEDPNGFAAHLEQKFNQRITSVELDFSERSARKEHGAEAVDAAYEAAIAAGVAPKFAQSRDGWGEMVAWHKAQIAAAEIGPDPMAYKDRLRAELKQELQAEMAAQGVKYPTSPTLAGQANLGTRSAPAWSGPTPLEDIFR